MYTKKFTKTNQFAAAVEFVRIHAAKIQGAEIRKQGSVGAARQAANAAELDNQVRAVPPENWVVEVTVDKDHDFAALEVWDSRVEGKRGLLFSRLRAGAVRIATQTVPGDTTQVSDRPAKPVTGPVKRKPAHVETVTPPVHEVAHITQQGPVRVRRTSNGSKPAPATKAKTSGREAQPVAPILPPPTTDTPPAHEAMHGVQQGRGRSHKTTDLLKPAPKMKSTAPSRVVVPNRSVDNYIASLNYDPHLVLSVVPDGTTSSQPVKDRNMVGNAVVICTKIQHTLNKNLSEVAILSPTTGTIFPGALVQADQNMMEGHPTPITLPRAPITLSVDLPGHGHPSGEVIPAYSNVQTFLSAKLGEWNRDAASQGFNKNAARSILQVSKAYSSQQVALELGFNAQWATGSASAQLGVANASEKSVVVAFYKQVFYTVTMDTPTSPARVFAKSVTLKQAQQAFDQAHPPAYVRSVDYGRILMIKMETSNVDRSVDLKAAFQVGDLGGSLNMAYREIFRNAVFTVLAIGGGADTPAATFVGFDDGNLQALQQYLTADTSYRPDNPGLPIAYTLAFLKDNVFARIGNTADYTETECVRYNNGFVRFVHSGAYIARFEVTWVEPDSNGNYTVTRQWESGDKTAGYTESIDLPGDAKMVRLKALANTGLVWDPWGEILNVVLDGPNNKTYQVTGTTLDRHWDNPAPPEGRLALV